MPFWNHSIIKKLRFEDDTNSFNQTVIKINNAAQIIKELDGITPQNKANLTQAIQDLHEWDYQRKPLADMEKRKQESAHYAKLFNQAKWRTVGVGLTGIALLLMAGHNLIENFDANNDSYFPYDAYLKFTLKFAALTLTTWEFTVHTFKAKREYAEKEGIATIENMYASPKKRSF